MKKQHILWASVAAAAVSLAACGGGSDNDNHTPSPNPSPSPSPSVRDRIEPLDTAKNAVAAKEQPQAVSRLPADAQVPRVALAPLADIKLQPASKDQPEQIGVGRALQATAKADEVNGQWRWQTLADGSRVAAVAFASEGAAALRLGLQVQQLPAGAVLRFYGLQKDAAVTEITADEVAQLRQQNENAGLSGAAAREVWGPVTDGEVTQLEVQLPPGVAPDALQLSVPVLSHLTQTVADAIAKDADDIGDSGSCNQDVVCQSSLSDESRSVAKMVFSRGGSSYLCTGTLMNDTAGSRTPYFLSANHCISDQSAASNLITYWFFRAASCNSSRYSSAALAMAGGAQLLFTNSEVDTTLLRLNRAAPANVVFAGSYFGSSVGVDAAVLGVHHPKGDLQKYSLGTIIGYGGCANGTCSVQSASNGSMFRVRWNRGTTEGGSSGSALFAQDSNTGTHYVVGALHGGNASCSNPNGQDFYGRFERAFAAGISNWLRR